MNWTLGIERSREALKRILAMLVAMAELDGAAGGEAALPRQARLAILRLLRSAEFAAPACDRRRAERGRDPRAAPQAPAEAEGVDPAQWRRHLLRLSIASVLAGAIQIIRLMIEQPLRKTGANSTAKKAADFTILILAPTQGGSYVARRG